MTPIAIAHLYHPVRPAYITPMRRFGEPVVPGMNYIDRPGAYAVIRDGRDVLITRQADPTPDFQLPGGGIDPGESPLPALHRECLEETGWKIQVERKLGAFQRYAWLPDYKFWARKVCHIYLARPVRRMGEPTEPGHSALWMSVDAASRLLGNAGDRHFVTRG
ncbi:NUDIX hydrolase [Amaricoccus tamworthensis]|uniref:NUDIX hydrolase n=1 Tax=Amaricoccus tamworthensis TaxID=57002 RepID=UPI003C7B9491